MQSRIASEATLHTSWSLSALPRRVTQPCASAVLMVAPHDFAFNSETAADNDFQQPTASTLQTLRQRALAEFEQLAATLQRHGVHVLRLARRRQAPSTPDAVFPNNWFATSPNGALWLFPMATPNRRHEKRPASLTALLRRQRYEVRDVCEVGKNPHVAHPLPPAGALEGTGALVFDHPNRRIYAALSARCDALHVQHFAQQAAYEAMVFQTRNRRGRPIYHTNIMLSLGAQLAVVGSACVHDALQRQRLRHWLAATHDVLELSAAQIEEHLCANILQLYTRQAGYLWVMSTRAYQGYTQAQRQRLATHGKLLVVPLDTIETVGGGSARCMLAEIFLRRLA